MSNTKSDLDSTLNLRGIAATVADELKHKGAIVISYCDTNIQIATHGLTSNEVREALCTAIHYSFVVEQDNN